MWRKQSNHTRKLQKTKDKQVTNYKLFKHYNKAIKSQGDGDGAGSVNMRRFSEADQVGASESNPDSGTSDVHASHDAERKRIKKKKTSAFEKARREWGKKQEEQLHVRQRRLHESSAKLKWRPRARGGASTLQSSRSVQKRASPR